MVKGVLEDQSWPMLICCVRTPDKHQLKSRPAWKIGVSEEPSQMPDRCRRSEWVSEWVSEWTVNTQFQVGLMRRQKCFHLHYWPLNVYNIILTVWFKLKTSRVPTPDRPCNLNQIQAVFCLIRETIKSWTGLQNPQDRGTAGSRKKIDPTENVQN